MKLFVTTITSLLLLSVVTFGQTRYAVTQNTSEDFTLASSGKVVPIYVSEGDYIGVIRAAKDLQQDFQRVTDLLPPLGTNVVPLSNEIIIIGTIGKIPMIDQLIKEKQI